jgi:hypothetical protein
MQDVMSAESGHRAHRSINAHALIEKKLEQRHVQRLVVEFGVFVEVDRDLFRRSSREHRPKDTI